MTVYVLWATAASAMARGDYRQAAAACRRLAAVEPAHEDALQALAVAETTVRGNADALSGVRFLRSTAATPGSATAWSNLAVHMSAVGGPANAVPYLAKAILVAPSSKQALASMGSMVRELRAVGDAVKFFARARAAEPADAELAYEHAATLLLIARRSEGAQALRQAIALSPSMASAHDARTVVSYELGDFVTARTTVSRECSIVGGGERRILRSIIIDASHPDDALYLPDLLARLSTMDGEVIVISADAAMIGRLGSYRRIDKFACTKGALGSARTFAIGLDLAEGAYVHLVHASFAGDPTDMAPLERFLAEHREVGMADVTHRHAESVIAAGQASLWLAIESGRWHDAGMNIDGTDERLDLAEIAARLARASLSLLTLRRAD